VEGCGDHGCEYMTGGVAVILGPTGKNFGAGMSGGLAFVYDPEGRLPARVNEDVKGDLLPLDEVKDVAVVKRLVQRHLRLTGSEVARRLLLNWEREKRSFVKVRSVGVGEGVEGCLVWGDWMHFGGGRCDYVWASSPLPPPLSLSLSLVSSTTNTQPHPPPSQVFPHEYRRAMGESEAVKTAEESQKELLASSGELFAQLWARLCC